MSGHLSRRVGVSRKRRERRTATKKSRRLVGLETEQLKQRYSERETRKKIRLMTQNDGILI